MADAACSGDTALMYGTSKAAEREALARCAACPVVDPCRRHAFETGERYGTRGGLTADERRQAASTAA